MRTLRHAAARGLARTCAAVLADKLDARITALYAYQLAVPPYPNDAEA